MDDCWLYLICIYAFREIHVSTISSEISLEEFSFHELVERIILFGNTLMILVFDVNTFNEYFYMFHKNFYKTLRNFFRKIFERIRWTQKYLHRFIQHKNIQWTLSNEIDYYLTSTVLTSGVFLLIHSNRKCLHGFIQHKTFHELSFHEWFRMKSNKY